VSSISPHNQLRACREHRGLTQHQAADQLVRVAWMRRGRRVGVNADMVSKWERGEKCPSPFYRELLCLLYQRTPDQLGVALERPGHLDVPAGDGEDMSSTLLEALSLIDQLVSRERVDFTFAGCFRTMTYVVDCCCAGAAERPR